MKLISENLALEKLRRLKDRFAARIRSDFEHRAKSCALCQTPGACCLDEHFVNVRISRLEAAAIKAAIGRLDPHNVERLLERVERSIKNYGLDQPGGLENTYACPLFEKGVGCLVHTEAKPLPCIQHACYENEKDLPPDELLVEHEGLVDELNRRAYGRAASLTPLPLAVRQSFK